MEKNLLHSIVKAALCAAFIFFSQSSFSQGNSGNGQGSGSGKPSISSLGLGKLPMWGLNANSIDSTAIFGSTNNMPVKVVVNNIHRGSFTNNGMELVGNFHSTFASVDSTVSSWKIITEILQAEAVRSEQYYQNDTLINLVNLQTTVANIKSSQWQNDTVNPSNIFYSGNVGIGVSNPSVPLEVSGSLKITGSDTTGSGGGGGGGGGGGTPPPAPGRSIIIDGGLDRIIATSGTLDFDNTNLTTTGSFQSNSITTANLTIIDKIESDSMHARKSIEINNSLRLLRDTSVMYAEMSTKDTAVALMLQKDAAAPVVIGDAPAPPPGESRAKLTVAGNTKLDGQLNVTGDITSAGSINANCVTTSCLNVSGQTNFDSLQVVSKIKTSRIVPADGDSLIHFGNNSVIINDSWNNLYGSNTNNSYFGNIRGIGLGDFPIAKATGSVALGAFTMVESNATGSVVIGQGIGFPNPQFLNNNIPNSLMVGFGSDIPTLFVSASNGSGTTGNIGIGTNDPMAKLDVRVPIDNNKIGAMVKNSSNDGIFIVPKLGAGGYNYHSVEGDAGILWDGYNPSSGLVIGPWYTQGWRGMRISHEGNVSIGTTQPTERLHIQNGSIYLEGENQGIIVDEGANKRVGLIKYAGRTPGIWRTTGQDFEIGRVNASSLPGSPTSFITDLLIGGDGNVGIGTDDPDCKLTVKSSFNAMCFEHDGNSLTPYLDIAFKDPASTDAYKRNWTIRAHTSNSTTPRALEIGSIMGGSFIITGPNTTDVKVGIGTTNPQKKLEVDAGNNGANGIRISSYVPTLYFKNQGYSNGHDWHISVAEIGSNATLAFKDENTNSFPMVINGDGNVGIGTTNPDAKLEVDGDAKIHGRMHSRSIRVNTNWSDFALEEDYQRMTVEEKEKFWKKYKHLPSVPSGKIIEKDGLDVGGVMKGMMQEVEESRLDITDLYKRLVKLEKENENLKKEIILLKSQK